MRPPVPFVRTLEAALAAYRLQVFVGRRWWTCRHLYTTGQNIRVSYRRGAPCWTLSPWMAERFWYRVRIRPDLFSIAEVGVPAPLGIEAAVSQALDKADGRGDLFD